MLTFKSISTLKLLTGAFAILVSTWSFAQCPPPGGGDFEGNLTITGTCTVSADLLLKKKNLTIASSGQLTVNGDFGNDGGGIITINGTLIVTGDFNNNGNGSVDIDGGNVDVTGSFNNFGNGVVTVDNDATLEVGANYFNSGNGTTNFNDGAIVIEGNYTNSGNGNISASGTVNVVGDFTVEGNGTNTISGGLVIGGTADIGSKGVDILDGGVLQANEIISEGDIDIANGGTVFSESGTITGTVNNDGGNADQDCTNNCCGALCNQTGDNLGEEGVAVLPIELIYFKAKPDDYGVLLEWSSAVEINNDYYTIERSYNGIDFEFVEYLDGAGNSKETLVYKVVDQPKSFGVIYYRLTQTDFDGAYEQFPLISANFNILSDTNIKVYPTLLSKGERINIVASFGTIQQISLKLIDVHGARYDVKGLQINSQITFSTDGLPAGIYVLRGSVNGITISKRLIIRD